MATAKKAPTKAPAKKPIKPAKHPGGRPSEYTPDCCDKVIAWGEQGKSKTWMAAKLGISRECIYEWARVHPEFSDALSRAMALSQMWWEDQGQANMLTPGFNAGVYNKALASRFPEDYTDKNKTELTGADGKPVSHSIEVSFVSASKG